MSKYTPDNFYYNVPVSVLNKLGCFSEEELDYFVRLVEEARDLKEYERLKEKFEEEL